MRTKVRRLLFSLTFPVTLHSPVTLHTKKIRPCLGLAVPFSVLAMGKLSPIPIHATAARIIFG
jgi:hypothetical protein